MLSLTECIHGLPLPSSTISLNLHNILPVLTWLNHLQNPEKMMSVWRFVFAFVSVPQWLDGSISSQATLRDDALRASTVTPGLP